MSGGRTLVTGWFSFLHGETTAGDDLALRHVQAHLDGAGVPYDTAWSPGFLPGGLSLDEVVPERYAQLLFVCGPVHGRRIAELHQRFAHCFRVALGVSAVDVRDPALTGFHRVLVRDGPGRDFPHGVPRLDLAASAPPLPPVPVAGVILTGGQREYGARRRHGDVAEAVTSWIGRKDCARLELDTRLDVHDWRHNATSGQFLSVLERLDVVVTDRLHGLVLALRSGVPALAIDPVAGGAKVAAQGRACHWPAVLPADRTGPAELDRWWEWCLGPGRRLARRRSRAFRRGRPAGR